MTGPRATKEEHSEENMRHVRNGVRYERTRVLAFVRAEREKAETEWKQVPARSPWDSHWDGYISACDAFIAWLEDQNESR